MRTEVWGKERVCRSGAGQWTILIVLALNYFVMRFFKVTFFNLFCFSSKMTRKKKGLFLQKNSTEEQ